MKGVSRIFVIKCGNRFSIIGEEGQENLKTIKIYNNFLYSELKIKKLLKVEYFVRIYQTLSATMQI